MLKLVLGFLADPKLKMEPDKRHEDVSYLIATEVFETLKKMNICYRLCLSSGDVLDVESRRMVRWDKQHFKLYMQKMERSSGHKMLWNMRFILLKKKQKGCCERMKSLFQIFVNWSDWVIWWSLKMKKMISWWRWRISKSLWRINATFLPHSPLPRYVFHLFA